MDATSLARLQFAVTTGFHFLFVTLTLGLALLVALLHTRYARTGDEDAARLTRFWGRIYVVNYAMGIVTGIVMEFQFGMNWNGLSQAVGNVFGAPLALETLIAFFAESTFLGVWIFGWGRLPRRLHVVSIWLVAVTAYLSAYWVLVANGFLHHPVGYVMRDGEAHITDFGALLANPFALFALGHVAAGAFITAGVFVAGISAYRLRRGESHERPLFERSLRTGVRMGAAGILPAIGFGVAQMIVIKSDQPGKDAAFSGDTAALAKVQAQAVARFGPGNYKPPVAIVQATSNAMMYIWGVLTIVLVVALVLLRGGKLYRAHRFQRLLVWAVPLPFVANIAGWLFRETGRQPWVVYGVLRTKDAVSGTSAATVGAALAAFTVLFVVLAAVDYLVVARLARGGVGGGDLIEAGLDNRPDITPVLAAPVAY